MKGELPADFDETVGRSDRAAASRRSENIATRKASQNAIEALAPALPEFLGGSRRPDRLEPDQLEGIERRAALTASRATTSTTACANSA